jgi:hypothetical protein
MKFDDILERIDYKTRERLVAAALYIPKLARGHGSIRPDERCNSANCRRGEAHTQERLEIAHGIMFRR